LGNEVRKVEYIVRAVCIKGEEVKGSVKVEDKHSSANLGGLRERVVEGGGVERRWPVRGRG
jgi:hypothetical protein